MRYFAPLQGNKDEAINDILRTTLQDPRLTPQMPRPQANSYQYQYRGNNDHGQLIGDRQCTTTQCKLNGLKAPAAELLHKNTFKLELNPKTYNKSLRDTQADRQGSLNRGNTLPSPGHMGRRWERKKNLQLMRTQQGSRIGRSDGTFWSTRIEQVQQPSGVNKIIFSVRCGEGEKRKEEERERE